MNKAANKWRRVINSQLNKFIKRINHYDDRYIKTRGNNVNVQLSGARTRHRKVFPEERTHTRERSADCSDFNPHHRADC